MNGVGECPRMCNAAPHYNTVEGCILPASGPIYPQLQVASCGGAGAWHSQG